MGRNKTRHGPTGPNARISMKPGKVRAPNYRYRLAVNAATGVIRHLEADFTGRRDSLHLSRLPNRFRHLLTRWAKNPENCLSSLYCACARIT